MAPQRRRRLVQCSAPKTGPIHIQGPLTPTMEWRHMRGLRGRINWALIGEGWWLEEHWWGGLQASGARSQRRPSGQRAAASGNELLGRHEGILQYDGTRPARRPALIAIPGAGRRTEQRQKPQKARGEAGTAGTAGLAPRERPCGQQQTSGDEAGRAAVGGRHGAAAGSGASAFISRRLVVLWQWWLFCGTPSLQIGIMRLALPTQCPVTPQTACQAADKRAWLWPPCMPSAISAAPRCRAHPAAGRGVLVKTQPSEGRAACDAARGCPPMRPRPAPRPLLRPSPHCQALAPCRRRRAGRTMPAPRLGATPAPLCPWSCSLGGPLKSKPAAIRSFAPPAAAPPRCLVKPVDDTG